ncbi:hypothetical protein CLOP_g14354 [Closterium sp. NIES-67]|nr:hypothetical protein CLOP_g14354 [Closterium sp. NIES-67]
MTPATPLLASQSPLRPSSRGGRSGRGEAGGDASSVAITPATPLLASQSPPRPSSRGGRSGRGRAEGEASTSDSSVSEAAAAAANSGLGRVVGRRVDSGGSDGGRAGRGGRRGGEGEEEDEEEIGRGGGGSGGGGGGGEVGERGRGGERGGGRGSEGGRESEEEGEDSDSDTETEFHCGAPEVGGHLLKVGVVVFQVLLCMRLEGQPIWAAHMSYWMLFSPLLAVQLAALMSALTQLAEGFLLLYAPDFGRRFSAVVREHDPFMFVTRGMRLAGWWWRDDEVREEQKSLTASLFPGTYDTFEAVPPDHIKRMRKGQLAEEVVRLQAALADQVETGKAQRQELERVQQEKVLCRVCFEREISLVLLPCRHRVLCHPCADKCKQCPICRRHIADRMAVFDV